MKVRPSNSLLLFVLIALHASLALALNTNLILFPGAFLPPHIGHFQNLENQIKTSQNSDVLIISFTGEQRDNVDSTVSASVWKNYYFPLLKKEFPSSVFTLIETPTDPHKFAFKEFSKESLAHQTGVVIAGDDRVDYVEKMKGAFEKLKASTGKIIKYDIMKRAEGVSATNLRKCIADAGESTGANFKNALKPCKTFFPAGVSDPEFAEIAVLVSKNMQRNRAESKNVPKSEPKVVPTGKDKSLPPAKPLPSPQGKAKPVSQDELMERFATMTQFQNVSTPDVATYFKKATVPVGSFVLKPKKTNNVWALAIVYKADADGKVGIVDLPVSTTQEQAKAKIEELRKANTITEPIKKITK